MTRTIEEVLMEIEVKAEKVRDALVLMEDSAEADTISDGFRSILWICADYMHDIKNMAHEAQNESLSE